MHSALSWRMSPVRPRLALVADARSHALTLMALTCVGFALRLVLLSAFPLREDEAIYGFWARAATTDPWFLHTWPDKPPLFIWLLMGAFALLGPSEATARLVSIFASTLTIPLVAMGACRLWHSRLAALIAALLITFTPYAVSFASTAYTDSLLILLGTGALVLALDGRGLGAGLLLGAACMTKQQGVFYLPLVIALLMFAPQAHAWRVRGAKLAWMVLGVALITQPILWWDSQRWAVAPSPWELAQRTYAPLAWLPPQQWLARWQAWTEWLWFLGGSWMVWVMLAAAMGAALVVAWRRPQVLLLLGWGIAFLVLHLITSVQVWDRYLLPLAPWLALVASGPLARVTQTRLPAWVRGVLLLFLVIGLAELVPPGMKAARGEMPIGGDHGDYAGLTEAIAWVEGQGVSPLLAPPEVKTVRLPNDGIHPPFPPYPAHLYHQVLGWHFRFYLYDWLQPRGDDPPRFDLRWFPSAAYLADNAAKSPYPPKYLIVPDWATPRDLALHLAMRGLTLEPRLHVGRFAVLEIVQPPRPMCDWCKSMVPFPPTLPSGAQMSIPSTP